MINEQFFADDYNKADQISKTLSDSLDVSRPVIDEDSFKNAWLPRFMNDKDDAVYQDWLTIAQSPFQEVDIYNQNQYIDTVPSIYLPYATPVYTPDMIEPTDTLIGTISEVDKLNANYGRHARERMMKAIYDKIRPEETTNTRIQFIKVKRVLDWDRIITRYGYPSQFTQEELKLLALDTPNNETKAIQGSKRYDEKDFEYEFEDA